MANEPSRPLTDAEQQRMTDPPPNGMPVEVHRYLSQAFGRLSGQIEGAERSSKEAAQASREVVARVHTLEWAVFGPSGPPEAPPPVPLEARLSSAEGHHEALATEALAAAGRLERLEAGLKSVQIETRRQSVESLGLARPNAGTGERWGAFLRSRSGRTFVLALATLVLGTITTISTTVIVSRSPAPSPALTSGR